MMKQFQWNNSQKAALLIILGWSFQAFAMTDVQFGYFGSKIEYWHDASEKKTASIPPSKNPAKPQDENTSTNGPFPWKTYLDPKNEEFFKEGDYTPPEPFMEIVRNPTDENLKLWFAYIDKKNELAHRLQEKMRDYLEKNQVSLGEAGRATLNAKVASLPQTEAIAKRYRFRMYFDSHCPHCRKMFGTLLDLQAKGFYVEAKQVDSDPRGLEGLGLPTSRASADEIKQKDIQSVPVLLIGDLETKTVYRLTGYQTVSDIFSALRQPMVPEGGSSMK